MEQSETREKIILQKPLLNLDFILLPFNQSDRLVILSLPSSRLPLSTSTSMLMELFTCAGGHGHVCSALRSFSLEEPSIGRHLPLDRKSHDYGHR